jgi:formamidopyrimidine-DNA glycosylase
MKEADMELWPPKYWKFQLETEGDPSVQVAFTDPRRFGRVRLVDCPGESIRDFSPLVENGPDPVVDKEIFTEDYLRGKMRSRHVPIKALLLDQAMISGIGNWVGDEVLYHAKLHPEQYCDDFGDDEIHALYDSIRYVCSLAVEKLGDSDEFPEHWLFNHRWGKGTKGASSHLPSGEKLAFLTVGGRTSCYAPAVQKKSGRTVPGAKEDPIKSNEECEAETKSKAAKSQARQIPPQDTERKRKRSGSATKKREIKIEVADDKRPAANRRRKTAQDEVDQVEQDVPTAKKRWARANAQNTNAESKMNNVATGLCQPMTELRRSNRLQGKQE